MAEQKKKDPVEEAQNLLGKKPAFDSETIEPLAKLQKQVFDAYIASGFNEHQALELTMGWIALTLKKNLT